MNDPNQPPRPYEQPPLPPTEYVPPPYQQPSTQYEPPMTEYAPPVNEQPPYAAPSPPYQQSQPQPKRSRRGLWIALAIIGAVLLLACGGCTAAAIAGVGFFASAVAGPSTAAHNYYQAIKARDYHLAFSYIDTSSISSQQYQQYTEDAFTLAAQAEDAASGTVTNFSQVRVSVDNNNSNSTALVVMSVTRSIKGTYTIDLQLRDENGVWKITDFSGI